VRDNLQAYAPAPLDMAPALCHIALDLRSHFSPVPDTMSGAGTVADREIGLSQGLSGHATPLIQARPVLIFQQDGGISVLAECPVTSDQLLPEPGQDGHRYPIGKDRLLLRPVSPMAPFTRVPSGDLSTTGTSWHAQDSPVYDWNRIAIGSRRWLRMPNGQSEVGCTATISYSVVARIKRT
jgi:hypothetical protein